MLAKIVGETFVVEVGSVRLRARLGQDAWCAKCQDWRLVA